MKKCLTSAAFVFNTGRTNAPDPSALEPSVFKVPNWIIIFPILLPVSQVKGVPLGGPSLGLMELSILCTASQHKGSRAMTPLGPHRDMETDQPLHSPDPRDYFAQYLHGPCKEVELVMPSPHTYTHTHNPP